jgi:hypothetical protein
MATSTTGPSVLWAAEVRLAWIATAAPAIIEKSIASLKVLSDLAPDGRL